MWTTQTHGHQTAHVYSIPSPNRWHNRTGKLFYRSNSKNDHQWWSKELGRQMTNGRVCAEQQCQCNNWICSVQAESGIHAPDWDANFIWHHVQGCQTIHITSEVGPNGGPWCDYRKSCLLSTQNLTLPKGRVRKLVPKYIGPYKVVKAHNEASTVTLELPPVLIAQWISPTFHMGLVRKFVANNDELFPKWDAESFYDFGQDDEQEWLVEEIITSHCWTNSKELKLEVR